MKTVEITQEFLEELYELARWEGCETGDLIFNLLDLYEGCVSYASDKFQEVLKDELIELHTFLKESKMEEDIEMVQNINPLTQEEKKALVLSKLTQEDKEILGLD